MNNTNNSYVFIDDFLNNSNVFIIHNKYNYKSNIITNNLIYVIIFILVLVLSICICYIIKYNRNIEKRDYF
jgi:hypothetical protein